MPDNEEMYKIWTPKFDGDAPPNWRDDMFVWKSPNGPKLDGAWNWFKGDEYNVPAEALATQ